MLLKMRFNFGCSGPEFGGVIGVVNSLRLSELPMRRFAPIGRGRLCVIRASSKSSMSAENTPDSSPPSSLPPNPRSSNVSYITERPAGGETSLGHSQVTLVTRDASPPSVGDVMVGGMLKTSDAKKGNMSKLYV